MVAPPIVEIRGLSVSYGAVRALRDVDLELRGGAVGLLGPNGAGKTTLLRVLLGLVRPDVGRVSILGHDPRFSEQRLKLRAKVGFMPESECAMPGMTGVEVVATLGRITGLAKHDAMARAHEVLDFAGLEEERYRESTVYSTGMKQRLKLAQALVHDPQLLLLDEPTNGLDPTGRIQMLELIEELSEQHGKHIILCSHLLPDVERVCRDVVVIERGTICRVSSLQDLTRSEDGWALLTLRGDLAAFVAGCAARGITVDSTTEPEQLRVRSNTDDLDDIFAWALESGVEIQSATPIRAKLEDVVLNLLQPRERV